MTKKDLLKWIEQQEEKVLTDLDKKRTEALEACTAKIIKEIGLDDIASKIQAKFNEINGMLSTWEDKLEPDMTVNHEYYNSLHSKINCFINGPIATRNMLLNGAVRIKQAKAYIGICKKYEELKKNVRHEYSSVFVNVQGLKNAVLGVEYLESLGFDLTKLKEACAKPVTTALAVPINTDFLFIGGKS